MDDFSVKDNRIDSALKELKTINRFLGGNSVTRNGFNIFTRKTNRQMNLRILDAGSGSSDVLMDLKKNYQLQVYALDKNLRVCFCSKDSNDINIICGDVFNLPIKEEQIDIVHASLFLHHFTYEQIRAVLVYLLKTAEMGIIINELRRNILALLGIKILTLFFSKSQLVKYDAPLSVRKGFVKKELEDILIGIPASEYIIKRKWAFRWLVVIIK
jgi:hypothetical protein